MLDKYFNDSNYEECLNLSIKLYEYDYHSEKSKIYFCKSYEKLFKNVENVEYELTNDLNLQTKFIAYKLEYYSKLYNNYINNWYELNLKKYLKYEFEIKYSNSENYIIDVPLDFAGYDIDRYEFRYLKDPYENPLNQMTKNIIYTKTFDFPVQITNEQSEVQILKIFPRITNKYFLKYNYIIPNQDIDLFYQDDVFSLNYHDKIKSVLNKLGDGTLDYPIDYYQNIIDPNLMLDEDQFWISTTYKIVASRIDENYIYNLFYYYSGKQFKPYKLPKSIIKLIFSYFNTSDILLTEDFDYTLKSYPLDYIQEYSFSSYPELNNIFNDILTAALPMIAALSKPSLLFPGYLQVVPKAQRIYLQPGEEYDGVWHQDGNEEHIIAVVLYYYNTIGFIGGDLEFIQRSGEYFYLYETFPDVRKMHNAKVETKTNRMVVFSNYELVHRVLKMKNEGDGVAYRDFVALFIVDQREHIRTSFDLIQKKQNVEKIEYEQSNLCSIVETNSNPIININKKDNIDFRIWWEMNKFKRYERREKKFRNQLIPKNTFGAHSTVYSTGNGTAAQITFYNDEIRYPESLYSREKKYKSSIYKIDQKSYRNMKKLNSMPLEIDRGISYSFPDSYKEEPKKSRRSKKINENQKNQKNIK